MLTAIDLNNELSLSAHEVDDVRADRFLPDKFEAAKAAVTEGEPQPHARRC